MTIPAIYENGVFRPLGEVQLPEKCEVELSVQPKKAEDRPLLRLLEIAQRYPSDPDAPTDMAAQVDHYLYGTPKRP
jgi:predicted DNA-binding antitoxin AbrB/MazE fold protein